MTKYACPLCCRRTTMTIIRELCVKGVQLVYDCSKCRGLWIIKENPRLLNRVGGALVQKGRTKGARFRSSSKG